MTSLIIAESWKLPLDVTLPVSSHGEIRIPFSRHIHQYDPAASDRTFPQYQKLPAELQLRVLRCCDKPTLFQLMHTSQGMRVESGNLFFSDPDALYSVSGEWLRKGGSAYDITNDLTFLERVERLYIDFWLMTETTWKGCGGNEEEKKAEAPKNIRRFWDTVRRRFPRAKFVVLTDDHDRGRVSFPTAEYEDVGRLGPPDMDIYIGLVQKVGDRTSRMKRKLWHRVKNEGALDTATSEWKECVDFLPPKIIPPQKPFHGPVGAYQELSFLFEKLDGRQYAARVHKITAVEKHHFQLSPGPPASQPLPSFQPFGCLAPGCDAWFERPGEYTSHAIDFSHDSYHDIPEPFKHDFAVNEEMVNALRDEDFKKERAFDNWWGKYGTEQHDMAKRAYTHQMIHDPVWAPDEPVDEQGVWDYMDRAVHGKGFVVSNCC